MGIFKKRPLAAGCAVFILTLVLLSSFKVPLLPSVLLLVLSAAGLALSLCLRHTRPYASLYLFLLLLGVLLASGRMLIDRAQRTPIEQAIGGQVAAEVCVEEISYQGSLANEYIVRVTELQSESTSIRVILRTEEELELREGELLRATFSVHSLTYEELYKGQATQYAGESCRAILLPAEIESIKMSARKTLPLLARQLQKKAAERLRSVLEGEAGDLAAAILLGERSGLDDTTVRDFRRAGVSHLLAISGLHLTLLTGMLERLLRLFRMPKAPRLLISALFATLYFFLTGSSYSTLRAMLILFFLYLAFFLREDADPLTSLFLVGALILLFTPSAIFSTSYQLTMLSVFGILTFRRFLSLTELIFPRGRGARGVLMRICRAMVASLATTLFATVAILPVQWLTFGELSLVAPLANLCILPFAAPLMLCMIVSLAVSLIPFLSALALPAQLLANGTLWLARQFSELHAMISLQYAFCSAILIPTYLVLALLLILDLKRLAGLSLAPVAVAAIAFVICLGGSGELDRERFVLTYRQDGACESLLLFGGGQGMLCDLSGGSLTHWNKAYRQLQEMGATELRVLLLTQYREPCVTAFSSLSSRVLVRELWLPEPETYAERKMQYLICKSAAERGVSVTVYAREEPLRVFYSAELTVGRVLYEPRSVKSAIALHLKNERSSFLYLSGAYPEYLAHRAAEPALPAAEVLLLGSTGPIPHEQFSLPAGAARVILTDERQLKLLAITQDHSYYYRPERIRLVMEP